MTFYLSNINDVTNNVIHNCIDNNIENISNIENNNMVSNLSFKEECICLYAPYSKCSIL